MTIQQTFELALQHHQAGRLPEAERLYRQILTQQPQHFGAMHYLGIIAHQAGRNDMAVDLIRRAISLNPKYAEAHGNLGCVLMDAGRFDEAIAACRQAIELNPNSPEAYNNLGNALHGRAQLDDAVSAYRKAIALRGNYAEAFGNLGNALNDKGQFDEAIIACRRAIALNPKSAEAHNNLGNALHGRSELDNAVAEYRRAIALNPNYAEAYSNLGVVMKDKGQIDEAIAAGRQAIILKPNYTEAHGNLLYVVHFHPAYDARAIAEEHRHWNRQHAEPLRKFIQPHSNDRNPDRRLRIGYVSPDFRDHCQSYFTIPLFAHHNHEQFEIFCYANVPRPDAVTDRIRGMADTWRSTLGMSDAQSAELVRNDRIDVLIDLTMHMKNGRSLLFARKPAPVQVTWLAYPGTTGLSTIDYRLTDPYLDPPGQGDEYYSEKSMRLPDTFWCYQPIVGDMEINPLPALAAGRITFGCLNNFCKINDGILSIWAQVLREVEGSQLLLLAAPGSHRQRTVDRLCKEGVDAGRIIFVPFQARQNYLELYHRIDIGLDSFPYNGHTTSLDSFWMGVPVVTLVGQTAVSRAGWCQLSNLGLAELAGQNAEQFVRIAVELTKDLPRLAEMRSTLRRRMEQSPLMDAPRFARNVEAAYRRMWHTWCQSA